MYREETRHRGWRQVLLSFATASLVVATLTACDDSNSSSDVASDSDAASSTNAFDVQELTIAQAQQAMRDGDLSCSQLVETYLQPIQRLDQDLAGGYPINSVLWVNENARDEAAARDAYLSQTGEIQGSLHCVPMLLKDNYETKDMPTTAASLTMLGAQPATDATTTYKLRRAGAVILGKATMSAWAMGGGGTTSRPRAGSPYDTAYLTSSSSSGPAAATSANFALAATGSDTCGSLVSPGTVNGVVAIRSSFGLVSQHGIVPLAHSHDVGGPMTRTVEDAVKLLNVMAGQDPLDPSTTADPSAQRYDDYTQFLDADGANGKRIGVLRSYGGSTATPTESASAQAVSNAIDTLAGLGAEIIDPIDFDSYNGQLLFGEAHGDLNGYYASHDTPVATVDALLSDPLVHPNVVSFLTNYPPQDDYSAGEQNNADNRQRLEALMDANDLDALVLEGGRACALSATTGIPYMVVPTNGERSGDDPRPTALGVMARKWDEARMLEVAYAYEQARGERPMPSVASSLEDDDSLPALEPASYNACVEEIALTARALQGDEYRGVTPEQYLDYVTTASCALPTHIAAGVK
jgi:Asp-tRNA(Asn)/Glu-tRNA(Gln) amidotransferase A subunit family amidase